MILKKSPRAEKFDGKKMVFPGSGKNSQTIRKKAVRKR
jgi:hypothetical protein